MRLLAFETATRRISVALWQDGALIERSEDLPNSGSERLLPWVHELLAEAEVGMSQIDGIAFGAGPGGFTGLRLACGVTQGLAYGLDIPVIPVSTLQALALASELHEVWTCLDARMNEIYAAAYRIADSQVTELMAPVCMVPTEARAPNFRAGWGIGDGFARYGAILRERKPDLAGVRDDLFPTAAAVAQLAAAELRAGRGVGAVEAQPIYIRDKVALTTAERLAQGGVR